MRSVVPAASGESGANARPSALGGGREFDLIRRFLRDGVRHAAPDVVLGPGDDAAIVRGPEIVISCDLSVEDVHFRRSWMEPAEIGFRAAASALSDLAAMAARPVGVLAALAVSQSDAESFAIELMRGVSNAVAEAGATLIGGDLTRSPGPAVLDVVVLGEAPSKVLRSGARPGDELWVTGDLGGAALGVRLLEDGLTPEPPIRQKVVRPEPRVRPALWLAQRGLATAMIDLSDGLGKDAGHIAAASGVSVYINPDDLPLNPTLAGAVGGPEALGLALSGGEDYELCFTAKAGAIQPSHAEFERDLGVRLTRVGRIESGSGVFLHPLGGQARPYHSEGFQHFGVPS